MHGFNQGFSTVRDLCHKISPDLFLLQEHWLVESNLYKFEQIFPDYFMFGSPAETSATSSLSRGRPAGGTTILIKMTSKNSVALCYQQIGAL